MLDEWRDAWLFSRVGIATMTLITYNTYMLQSIPVNKLILVCNNTTGNFTVSHLFIGESKLSTPLSIQNL